MTAKEWLSRARKMSGRLRALQTSKEQAFARATSVVVGGGEHVSGGEPADKHAAYAELSLAVDRQTEKLEQVRAEILQVIGQIEDNTLAALLTEYYVNDRTWEEVAVQMGYSWRWVRRLHARALDQVQEILDNRPC